MRQTGFIGVLRLVFLSIGFILFMFMVVVSARSASSIEAVAGRRSIATIGGRPLILIARSSSRLVTAAPVSAINTPRPVSSVAPAKSSQGVASKPTNPGKLVKVAAAVPQEISVASKPLKAQAAPVHPVAHGLQLQASKLSDKAFGL